MFYRVVLYTFLEASAFRYYTILRCLFPDLLLVQNPEELLGRVKALAVFPSQQKKETGQRVKLCPKQCLQFRKLLLFYEVKPCDLPTNKDSQVT